MKITEVRIFRKESADKKLKAFATITFDDCFVVRDVKVIEGNKGFFVAMPSRRAKEPCPTCGHRNMVRSHYCSQCGASLPVDAGRAQLLDEKTRQGEHKDIAHPITLAFREYVQKYVLETYERECARGAAGQASGPHHDFEAEIE